MHPNPPEACLNPRLLGPAPVSDSVDLTWSLRTCISGRFTGDAAASVGTTLGWGPIILGDLSHRRMIIWPGEELEPFLAPEVDQVWAGLCSVTPGLSPLQSEALGIWGGGGPALMAFKEISHVQW